VIDEVKYSGRVNELDFFLPSWQWNIDSPKAQIRRGDPDHVKCTVSVPNTWCNHPDLT
jgi:hypothetical protein